MSSATADLDLIAVPEIARRTGAGDWACRAVLDGLGIAQRVGRARVIDARDLPIVAAELGRRGYLRPAGREVAAC